MAGIDTMIEQTSAQEIGRYGYAHWTDKPVTPGAHEIAFVPQTIADGWEAYCSCGEWRAFESFYGIQDRDELIAALRSAFAAHIELARNQTKSDSA